MYRLVIGCVVGWALVVGVHAREQHQDVAAGQRLYRESCGVCHGMIAPEGASYRLPSTRPVVHVALSPSGATSGQMAVAPPYGPSLRGVYGRQAGSVQGFVYSRAFKKVLHGVVWNRQSLDKWITDSQAWVPGSLMFYKQPDAEIRQQIITYLQTTR